MIAVIADDLTGAAELGGIGIRHGLKTEIRTAVGSATDAHLLIIAADSRSKDEPAAIEEMTIITQQLRTLNPEWVYKKTDSVLRGHVLADLFHRRIQFRLAPPGDENVSAFRDEALMRQINTMGADYDRLAREINANLPADQRP